MTRMKRVLTIQDLSAFGKCSLTITLPVLSAMGVEAVPLPTALLSSHTMFPGAVSFDLAGKAEPITRHWKELGLTFDMIYTGYLGSAELIGRAMQVIRDFRTEDTLIFVDPVMGDHGKLYRAFGPDYPELNKPLCALADILIPNLTEAAYLTGLPVNENPDRRKAEELLRSLTCAGPRIALLTGVSFSAEQTGVMGYDRLTDEYFLYQNGRIPAAYHGTGDLFASVFAGALMRGRTWQDAARLAADHTAHTIDITKKDGAPPAFGIRFEETMPDLVLQMQNDA